MNISHFVFSLVVGHLDCFCLLWIMGFPDSSVGKKSACDAGDPGLIPGSGRSPGEGIGYPLQYSWASLVAQMVKNLPAMWETWVRSLGWEDSPRRAWQTTPVFLPGVPPQSMGLQWVVHAWATKHSTAHVRATLILGDHLHQCLIMVVHHNSL